AACQSWRQHAVHTLREAPPGSTRVRRARSRCEQGRNLARRGKGSHSWRGELVVGGGPACPKEKSRDDAHHARRPPLTDADGPPHEACHLSLALRRFSEATLPAPGGFVKQKNAPLC